MHRAAPVPAILAVLVLALPAARARADEAPPPLPAHGHALDFSLSGLSLGAFDGGTLSWRQQRGEHAAWRLGLSASVTLDRASAGTTPGGTDVPATQVGRSNAATLGVSVTRLTFPAPRAAVRPYLGVGAGAGWTEGLDEETMTTHPPDPDLATVVYTSEHTWGPTWSAFALFGLEWAFDGRFALHAEYGEAVVYEPAHNEMRLRNSTPLSVNEDVRLTGSDRYWTIGSRSVHAGLSVFW